MTDWRTGNLSRGMSILRARRGRGDTTLYARAIPQQVHLTETYSVEQEISRNPSIQQVGDGTGRIEIRVPYDGRGHFTRQAVADVERALGSGGGVGDRRATIGHLLLADHTKATGLRGVMRPHNQAGLIPLSVPAATPDGSLSLTGDRQTCVITYDYQPDQPPICPVDLTVHLDDLDSLTGAFESEQTLVSQGRENPSRVIERLRQEASFSSELLLRFVVRISVPVKADYPRFTPVVKHMSVGWPTLTSLRSTKLSLTNLEHAAKEKFKAAHVRYNPVKGRLEWKDVPVRELPGGPGREAGTRIFESAEVLLQIGHPGELYKEDHLEVNAQVETPLYLMSGLEARLFDATGRSQARQPKLTTKLDIRTLVYPADIFAGRTFSPYQQFVFDDITPDEMRITDIVTSLRNSKFSVDPPLAAQPDPAPTWLLLAQRSQGPDHLGLLIAVEGKRATLDREQLMAASVKISGSKETGQLKVSVLGTLPRDHKELTREMNALQQALRDRFRFHQTSRK